MGKGSLAAASWKHKINELVSLDDGPPLINKYFLEAEGYTVEHNIVH